MSSKKRKGDLPANVTAEAAHKATRNDKSSQSKPNIDDDDDDGDDDEDHATTRMQRDEARAERDEAWAELAAERLKIERLEAAASEPCARCHFYSDWTVRVRTMSGQVYTIACPDGPKTLVAHVKEKLALFDPKCHILEQVTLVLPCEASSSSGSSSIVDPTHSALADDRTLVSYGISKSYALDLFLVDMKWSKQCRQIIKYIKGANQDIIIDTVIDDDSSLAVSWALVNSINPAATSLTFPDESVSAGAASKICAALCALSTAECPQAGPRVSMLDLRGNEIGDAGANSCSELMRVSAWLKALYLGECGISSAGAVSIGSALRASTSHQLQILNLRGNNIGADGAKSIGTALSVSTSLQELSLIECKIDTDGVEALAEALKINGSLRELYIDDNGIDASDAAFLADALQLNSSLRYLSIGNNYIGDEGAVLLSAALRMNSTMVRLDLDGNRIGDRGAASFGAALRANSSLQSLDLSRNDIGDLGSISLGIALAFNSSLTCIELHYNEFGDGGAVALCEGLCANSNSALTTLSLYDNKIGALGAESIGKAQRENSRLQPISLERVDREED